MENDVVVGSDLMPDWLERRNRIMGEIDGQLARGLKEPGKGLTLGHLQCLVEHRDPFSTANCSFVQWRRFYGEVLGRKLPFSSMDINSDMKDPTDIMIPERRGLSAADIIEVFVRLTSRMSGVIQNEHAVELMLGRSNAPSPGELLFVPNPVFVSGCAVSEDIPLLSCLNMVQHAGQGTRIASLAQGLLLITFLWWRQAAGFASFVCGDFSKEATLKMEYHWKREPKITISLWSPDKVGLEKLLIVR